MMSFAAGYQHFADGAPFAEIALRHPSVKEVYFPWVGEPSGRPMPGFSPAFFPNFVDNSAFPADWFERTSACARECAECGYCERVWNLVAGRF